MGWSCCKTGLKYGGKSCSFVLMSVQCLGGKGPSNVPNSQLLFTSGGIEIRGVVPPLLL